MLFEYDGYKLTKCWYDMTEAEKFTIVACCSMIKNNLTIRGTAKSFGVCSHVTLWRRIHDTCSSLSPDLYKDMLDLLDGNKRKGGRHKKWKKR